MKMPNFDFTLLWKEQNHENLFAMNNLASLYWSESQTS